MTTIGLLSNSHEMAVHEAYLGTRHAEKTEMGKTEKRENVN